MEPITHVWLTRRLVGKDSGTVLAGILPDAPFYLTYPLWLARQGKVWQGLHKNEWAEPPSWIRSGHDAFHSLPFMLVVGLAFRLIKGRWPRQVMLAWSLHILVDIPTHSRQLWGTRFLWPLSSYVVDGVSWVSGVLWLWRWAWSKGNDRCPLNV